MSGMKVNFNNLRRQAMNACDSLTQKLNDAIIKGDDQYAKPNAVYHDQQVNLKGYVLVDAEEIQKEMDSLRSMIGSVAMVYEDGNKDFVDVYEQAYPEKSGGSMKSFNEPEDNE